MHKKFKKMKLTYSIQLLSISLSPSLSLFSLCDDPPTPPSRGMAFPIVIKSAKDVLGCLHRDDCQCGLLALRSLLFSLQTGGGIPVNLASHQDDNTVCNELQSNNLAHKGGGPEGGLIFYGLGAG